jgi:hypothetical protein
MWEQNFTSKLSEKANSVNINKRETMKGGLENKAKDKT